MSQTTTVIARLYEHIEPLDRGTRYEDPLDAALRDADVGEVTGGGSQLSERGEIEFADVEIQVSNLDAALPLIARALEQAGAPTGSQLFGPDGVIRELGGRQSVAVYLDGVSLPDEVYANLDFDDLIERLGDAAGADSYHGCWQGARETGLFFFGDDAESMCARLEPVLREMPIGQNARVVVRAARADSPTRTIHLPRH